MVCLHASGRPAQAQGLNALSTLHFGCIAQLDCSDWRKDRHFVPAYSYAKHQAQLQWISSLRASCSAEWHRVSVSASCCGCGRHVGE
jgi:hypothetical protein